MKRYAPRQLMPPLATVVVVALSILGRPVGLWVALGAAILGSIALLPAVALALLLRTIGRSPAGRLPPLEGTQHAPSPRRPAVVCLPGNIR